MPERRPSRARPDARCQDRTPDEEGNGMSLLNLRDEPHHDSDELVARLRNLQWDDVNPELRDRCWREFNRMLAERDERIPRRQGGGEAFRLDFTRPRSRMEGIVAGERMRVARRLTGDRRFRPAYV